jgi:hypothetical protein
MFPIFFWIFRPNQIGYNPVWVTPEWSQESAVKNWAQMEHRAKSYARFMEGTSSYGFQGHKLAGTVAAAIDHRGTNLPGISNR